MNSVHDFVRRTQASNSLHALDADAVFIHDGSRTGSFERLCISIHIERRAARVVRVAKSRSIDVGHDFLGVLDKLGRRNKSDVRQSVSVGCAGTSAYKNTRETVDLD